MLGPLLIFLCALLWGTAFVAQKLVADNLGPFAIVFVRSILAAAFLYGWSLIAKGSGFTRKAWIGGTLSGAVLFVAMLCQQIGMIYTTPGISAFLTSNYILLVPILGMMVGRRTTPGIWLGVAMALIGSYLICMPPGEAFAMGRGEWWVIACAFLFALQILFVDHFVRDVDVIAFSCVQQLACIAYSAPFLLLSSERVHFNYSDCIASIWPMIYIGIVSSGIAYTLQNLGQAHTPPALAAVCMSLEAVFGAISGYLVLGDVLTRMQIVGCALLFFAALVASLYPRRCA